jgi:penicillin amidase
MKLIRFIISLLITVSLVYVFNSTIVVNETAIPPLGKLLDPVNGFWQNAETAEVPDTEFLDLQGLDKEVEIIFDDRLVPHIFASTPRDLFFAQGYITARYRLWQMDFQTRAATGRLSEILYHSLGNKVLQFDRIQRRMGMKHAAEKALEEFKNDSEANMVLNAYTDGVNAYIKSLSYKDYPLEFKLLNYEPELWKPVNCAVLLKYMAKMLTGGDDDFALTNALNLFGKETVDLLFPDYQSTVESPIVPPGTVFEKDSVISLDTPKVLINNILVGKYKVEEFPRGLGSNNWAISGAKTVTGSPMLCNDPHLMLNFPSIWYELQMHCPEYNVYGVSLPGSPAVIIGFNEHISWGVTNGSRDVKDWYRLKFKNASKSDYWVDGEWRKVEKIKDTIWLKGVSKPYIDEISVTDFGIIVFEDSLVKDTLSANLAMKWAAHIPGNELQTFVKLNRAKNYNDYVEALKSFVCPAQNFVFASKSGDIAIWQNGLMVQKWPEQGRFVMDGTDSRYNWQKYLIHNQTPHAFNPDRGYVFSANQHPTDRSYPYYYNGVFEYYRNRRIDRELAGQEKHSVESMMKLQNDNFNLQAAESLPYMLSLIREKDIKKEQQHYLDELKKWNFYSDPQLTAPSIYELWFDKLEYLLWDEFRVENLELIYPQNYNTIRFIKEQPGHRFFDIKSTPEKETLKDIMLQALKLALDSLDNFQKKSGNISWANFKGTSIQHLLATLKPFGKFKINIGGNKGIVNACSDRWGPSWRMVVSLEKETKAFGIYPGGQSGNPGSPFYDNFVDKWAAGEYYELIFLKNPDENNPRLRSKQKLY